jgi:hypothetical protein
MLKAIGSSLIVLISTDVLYTIAFRIILREGESN